MRLKRKTRRILRKMTDGIVLTIAIVFGLAFLWMLVNIGILVYNSIIEPRIDSEAPSYLGNHVFIMDEAGYSRLDEYDMTEVLQEGSSVSLPTVDVLVVGKTYYAVAYSQFESRGDATLSFTGGNMTFSTDSTRLSAKDSVEVLNTSVKGDVEVELALKPSEKGDVSYDVTVPSNLSHAEYCICIPFRLTQTCELRVEYTMVVASWMESRKFWVKPGVDQILTTGYPTIVTATSLERNQLTLQQFDVGYLQPDQYIDGRFDPSAPVLSFKPTVDEKYYMVLTADLDAVIAPNTEENVTFSVKLPTGDGLDGTLEYAGSGSYTEVVTDAEKVIRVTYIFAGNESKEICIILKLTPTESGTARIEIDYDASDGQLLGPWESICKSHPQTVCAPGNGT